MRLLYYLPGVKTVTEGDMGIYVRGGNADQNLIVYDNAVVYNPTHVLGFFSIFNEDIIDNVRFYKSGIPASYANRLSSAIDIRSVDSIPETASFSGSLGILSTKVMGYVPFHNHNGAIYIAARKSYIDEIIKPAANLIFKNQSSVFNSARYSFYDLNMKAVYRLNLNNKLVVSFYGGKDVFDMEKESADYKNNFFWQNRLISINWQHYFNNRNYLENTFYYTNTIFSLTQGKAQSALACSQELMISVIN
ncbi:MAG: Plug domain-containing protein [Bacteroidales bacterium]|nr:Plug domain-containing protein [Bacteroidales bacterium]